MSRSRLKLMKAFIWSIAGLAVVAGGLWFVPTNAVVLAPGITGDLSQMVQVKGGHAPGPGRLLMVAVTIARANVLVQLVARVDPNLEILPRQQAMGGLTMQQYIQFNLALMQQSQWAAEVAGERLAGLPARVVTVAGAVVEQVSKTGTAVGKIHPGDLIVRIGSYPVSGPAQVRSIMEKHFRVGEIVNFTVVRNHQQRVIPLKTTRIPGDPAPGIGVLIGSLQRPVIPRTVTIHSQNIGGPSAGMMFALEIYQQVTGHQLARGRIIAGTGEVSPNGQILQIGGVAQKVITVHRAGAQTFLVPAANYQKAEWMNHLKGYHMAIYPVHTLAQALHDLTSLNS
ncbi:MAG: signal protein PDZ [Thermaerobacter sp.]|nr:signal protein PDZ [Thermaerobacter sp.]